MGKALLIMVLGTGLFVSVGYMSTQDSLVRTAQQQAGYEEEVVAREIARSGFNVAMGIVRPYGANLLDAVNAVNGEEGVMKGQHQGGDYRVVANHLGGFEIEIVATGFYGGTWEGDEYIGGATHTMSDRYEIPVLMARRCSVLRAKFLDSRAGYCSAIYLDRYPLGVTAETKPDPEMLFAASHNSDYDTLTVSKYVAPGTQMNFFIGVDQNCSTRPYNPRTYDVENHVFDADDYDYLHYALDLEVDALENMEESLWGFVEEHPANNQRWRIGWEDIHNLSWDDPDGTNPRSSIQALKRYGYDLNRDGRGDGWRERDAAGYRLLYDGSLDLSDQVIEVWLDPVSPEESEGVCPTYTVSVPGDDDVPGGGDDGGLDGRDGTTGVGGDGGGGSGSSSDCPCPQQNNDKKVYIMHYPQGNMSNPQDICISRNGWINQRHSRHNGDYIICEGE